ncbi:MAG: hypothetical protein RL033_444, partial [Pseudomonadota bacterium]
PVGAAAPREIDAAAVPVLQRIAWETVEAYRARVGSPPALAECRTRIAKEICPAYYRLRGKPEKVAQCSAWASDESPLAD